MRVLVCIISLLFLDLVTKYLFRFSEHSWGLPLVLIEGYLYVDEVFFNYGNVFAGSHGPEGVSTLSNMISYLIGIVAILGASIAIISREVEGEGFGLTLSPIILISGILGNLCERFYYGNVCDWLTITRPEVSYIYAANLADIFIFLGLLCMALVVAETLRGRLIWIGLVTTQIVWLLQNIIF